MTFELIVGVAHIFEMVSHAQQINTLHTEIIYMSPFINAEILK